MPQGGDEYLQHVPGGQPQGGGVDTGVAAEVLRLQQVPVDEQVYLLFPVIHQPQKGQGAGGDVQEGFHGLTGGKGQPGGANLLGQLGGFEGLVPGNQEKIKFRLLPVAKEQILAQGRTEGLVHLPAGLHGHGLDMVSPEVLYGKTVHFPAARRGRWAVPIPIP